MDFQKLLDLASEKDKDSSIKLSTSKTGFNTQKFDAPKRIAPKPKVKVKKKTCPEVDTCAVKSYLLKKQAAEKEKAAEAERKKLELLKAREEAKNKTRARAMASRTKDNLKVYTGPPPDSPHKDKNKQLADKKHREFMDSIEKSRRREEAKVKRVDELLNTVKVKNDKSSGRKKKATPPMSFEELLRAAAKNKDKAPPSEKNGSVESSSEDSEEEEEDSKRIVQRERDERHYKKTPTRMLQKMARKRAEEWEELHGKFERKLTDVKADKKYAVSVGSSRDTTVSLNPGKRKEVVEERPAKKPSDKSASHSQKPRPSDSHNHKSTSVNSNYKKSSNSHAQKSRSMDSHGKQSHPNEHKGYNSRPNESRNKNMLNSTKPGQSLKSGQSSKLNSSNNNSARKQSNAVKVKKYAQTNDNVLVCGPGKPVAPQASNPWDRIYGDIQKRRPEKMAPKRHMAIDSDEEEDSEMDDFIDNGPEDGGNVSSYIKEIFGYDKNRYRHEREEDLRDMESNFVSQMKEEKMSARLGKKEDLEDMRRELEEAKRYKKRKH